MAKYDREALIKEASKFEDDFTFLKHLYQEDAERSAFLKNFDIFDQACLNSSTSWYQFMTKHKDRLNAPPTKEMMAEISAIVSRAEKLTILAKDFRSRIHKFKDEAYGREHKALMSLLEIIGDNEESLNFVLSLKPQLGQGRKAGANQRR